MVTSVRTPVWAAGLVLVLACGNADSGESGSGASADSEGGSMGSAGDASASTTASGSTTTTSADGSASATEGGTQTSADGSESGTDEDIEVWELRAGGFMPPTDETFYSCMSFNFPVDQLHHIVGFVPQVTNPLVHHYVLSTSDEPLELNPSDSCFEWPSQIIWAWGPGGQEFMLPPEAGILVGHTGDTATFVLQVHYNNPLGMQFADNDGLDLLVTKQLRPNRAAVFSQGDIYTIAIPPGQAAYEHIASCGGNLTDGFFPEPINVVGVLLHAHQMGNRIRTDIIRDGMPAVILHEEDPYDFSSQSFDPIDFVIQPGDTIETHCFYDSTMASGITTGGPASDEEMCINFMMYWPYVDAQICGAL